MTTIDLYDMPRFVRRRAGRKGWLKTLLLNWKIRRRRRRAFADLSHLDPYLLRDVGLSADDVKNGLRGRPRSIWLNPLPRDED